MQGRGAAWALQLAVWALLCTACTSTAPPTGPAPPPAEPRTGDADWVRLQSGEWLKGELEWMRQDELLIDSDKLDEQSFDWEDVVEVWTSRPMTVLFDDLSSYTGSIHVVDGEVRVSDDRAPPELLRANLLSIVHVGGEDEFPWSGEISLGLNTQSGNTEQEDFTALVEVRRDHARAVSQFEYAGQISSVNGDETANNHYARGTHQVTVSRRAYVTPVYIDLLADRFKNIDSQITAGSLAGYRLIDERDHGWSVGAGVAAQRTKYRSVAPGEDQTETVPVALFVTDYEVDLTKNWDLDLSFSHQARIGDAGDSRTRLQAQSSHDLTERFELDVTFIWTRIGSTAPQLDGENPKNSDYTLSVGLGYTF